MTIYTTNENVFITDDEQAELVYFEQGSQFVLKYIQIWRGVEDLVCLENNKKLFKVHRSSFDRWFTKRHLEEV